MLLQVIDLTPVLDGVVLGGSEGLRCDLTSLEYQLVQRRADVEDAVNMSVLQNHHLDTVDEVSGAGVPIEARIRAPADWPFFCRFYNPSIAID